MPSPRSTTSALRLAKAQHLIGKTLCRCITTGHPSVRQIQGLHCCETPFMSDGKLLNCDSLYRLVAHPSNHWTRSRATDIDNRGMRFAASSILPSPSICLDAYRRRESVEACRSGTSPQTLREDNKSSLGGFNVPISQLVAKPVTIWSILHAVVKFYLRAPQQHEEPVANRKGAR